MLNFCKSSAIKNKQKRFVEKRKKNPNILSKNDNENKK